MVRSLVLVLVGFAFAARGAFGQEVLRVRSRALDEEREVFIDLPDGYIEGTAGI